MTTAQSVLERHFPGLTPEEVDAELSNSAVLGASPLSAAALDYLSEHGGEAARNALADDDAAAVQRDRALTAARTLERLLTSSLSTEDASAGLQVSRSRISHRLRGRTLYAFDVQGRRRLPRWQFWRGSAGARLAPIPGLAQIVAAIPRALHPLALQAFMTGPLEELGGVSPVDHLCSFADPEVVADWLESLDHA